MAQVAGFGASALLVLVSKALSDPVELDFRISDWKSLLLRTSTELENVHGMRCAHRALSSQLSADRRYARGERSRSPQR